MLQLHKLMVYDPEVQSLSGKELQQFQELWANNGDAISRQYTGTDALKVIFICRNFFIEIHVDYYTCHRQF